MTQQDSASGGSLSTTSENNGHVPAGGAFSTPATDMANCPSKSDGGDQLPLSRHFEREKSPPVRQRGKMTADGYQPENAGRLDLLTAPDPRRPGLLIGLDPMTISPALLTAAGHPPRRTAELVSAKRAAIGDAADWYQGVREYSHITELVCLPCAGTAGEVRRCEIINCPMWAYRRGSNPHSPRRGKMPAGFDRRPIIDVAGEFESGGVR